MTALVSVAVGLAAGALVAVPAAIVTMPEQDEQSRRGSCGLGGYELSVDREGSRFETAVELEGLPPGSRWRVVLRHDGEIVASVRRWADHEGDLDLERHRPDTAREDVFRFAAHDVGGTTSCRARIATA